MVNVWRRFVVASVLINAGPALVLGQLPALDDVPRLWPQPASMAPGEAGAAHLTLAPTDFQIVSTTVAPHHRCLTVNP